MCGIAGIFKLEISEVDVNLVKQMLHTQHHRGPDATGIKSLKHGVLGHNRLSIIDLSEVSNQPFDYEYITLSYNGEVYNYIELKEELQLLGYRFNSSGDTEVICAAYLHWGFECVSHFVGMWAFALWDAKLDLLFCSRDRFGIKPFHYVNDDHQFSFASEIRTLQQLPYFDYTINIRQAAKGINLGLASYKDETYFENVHQLRNAHNMVWENGKIRIWRYWDLQKVPVPRTFKEATDKFRELFDESLKIHTRSDVPIGSCLSGGIDSSAIVSRLAELHPNDVFKTFTIYYANDVDERPFAEEVAKKYKNVKSIYKEPSETEIEADFETFLDNIKLPPAGSSYYSQYMVMKLAADHNIKVLINGQGSDEYLVGYMHSYYRILSDLLLHFKLKTYWTTLQFHTKQQQLEIKDILRTIGMSFISFCLNENELHHFELKQKYKKQVGLDYNRHSLNLEKKFTSRTDNFLYHLIMTTTLPTLLFFEDRNSMAFSIESRVPFLDHRLVEYGFSLPLKWRLHEGKTKFVLRKAYQNTLPKKIYERTDKKGFVTPGEKKWSAGALKLHFVTASSNPVLNWRVNMLRIWRSRNLPKAEY